MIGLCIHLGVQEEAATRHALLQQRIAEAEDDARRAREDARRGRGQQPWLSTTGEFDRQYVESAPKHAMSTVHFQEPEGYCREVVPQRSSQLLLQHDNDLRSPSMQVLAELASPRHAGAQRDRRDGGHKDAAHSHSGPSLSSKKQQKGGDNSERKWRSERRNPLASQSQTALKGGRGSGQRGAGRGPRDGVSKSQKTATTREAPSRSSKIPVRKAVNSGRGPHSGRVTHTDSSPHKASAKERAIVQHKATASSHPVPAPAHKLKLPGNASSYQPPLRSSSPPVPALARQLAQKKNPTLTTLGKSVSLPSNAGSSPEQPHRSVSPPVPAIANKLHAERLHSPPVPTIANRLHAERLHSPPIPALANRLQMDTNPLRTSPKRNVTQNSNTMPSQLQSAHPLVDDDVCYPINRPPSCAPITSPLDTRHLATGATPHLPSAYHTLQLSTAGQSSRQEKLLHELASLRKVHADTLSGATALGWVAGPTSCHPCPASCW